MNTLTQEYSNLKTKLSEEFKTFEASLNGQSKSSLHKIRQEAISSIGEFGFPTKKSEDWKYTNPSGILKNDYLNSIMHPLSDLTAEELKGIVTDNDSNVLVFINGRFASGLSGLVSKGNNSFIGSFADAYAQRPDIIENYFAKLTPYNIGSFPALNTAFAADGAVVHAGANAEIPEIIRIINIADARNGSYLSQPRNIFVIEQGARAMISEEFFTIGDNPCFTNMVTEIFCSPDSMLEHYKIQNDGPNAFHVGTANIKQEAKSHYSNTTISWGGNTLRNNLRAEFAGQNTECHFYGLYLATGRQHIDNHTLADHAMPNCYSNELYKGIIADKATGVFNGRILVRPDAQKTNAYQSNKSILISEDAMSYSKPQLEIFADDVKCSHGATTGQLSNEEIFYLQSRGITKDLAVTMLLQAFAGDVIDTVKDNHLREKLEWKLIEILNRAR